MENTKIIFWVSDRGEICCEEHLPADGRYTLSGRPDAKRIYTSSGNHSIQWNICEIPLGGEMTYHQEVVNDCGCMICGLLEACTPEQARAALHRFGLANRISG